MCWTGCGRKTRSPSEKVEEDGKNCSFAQSTRIRGPQPRDQHNTKKNSFELKLRQILPILDQGQPLRRDFPKLSKTPGSNIGKGLFPFLRDLCCTWRNSPLVQGSSSHPLSKIYVMIRTALTRIELKQISGMCKVPLIAPIKNKVNIQSFVGNKTSGLPSDYSSESPSNRLAVAISTTIYH